MRKYTVEKRKIPSTGRDIKILIFRPTAAKKEPEQTPGVLWIHGGGYATGMAEMAYFSRPLALVKKYGAVVVCVSYRLSIEAPYPAALCMYARDKGSVNIAYQMPLYPMLNDRDTESSRDNHAPIWNTKRNHAAWKLYLKGLTEIPPYAAPARQTDYSNLPPAYTFVGDIEPFYCETLTYIENLKAAGVEASVDVYPNWFHAYDMFFPFKAVAKQAIAKFEEQFCYAAEHYFAPQNKE